MPPKTYIPEVPSGRSSFENNTPARGGQDQTESSARYLLEDNLTVLFQAAYRDRWGSFLLTNNSASIPLAMDDSDLAQLPGWSVDDENPILVMLSSSCALGLISYDESWYFTDLIWELADTIVKEGRTFKDFSIEDALRWWTNDRGLGSLLANQVHAAWNKFDHPNQKEDHTAIRLLTRFAAFPMGFTHSDVRLIAADINISKDDALSILAAATTLGVIRHNGVRWMPEVSIGSLIGFAK